MIKKNSFKQLDKIMNKNLISLHKLHNILQE